MNEMERIYFENIYDRNAATLYRVAYSYMGAKQDAEDAVTDTFLQLVASPVGFTSAAHERAWLIRVCINVCKNKRKEYWRRNVSELKETYPCPETVTDGYVTECVQKLPARQRTVIYLFYYEGYAVREISGMLDLSQSGVKTQLCRARQALKNIINLDEV